MIVASLDLHHEALLVELEDEARALQRLLGESFCASPSEIRRRVGGLRAEQRQRVVRESYDVLVRLRIPPLMQTATELRALRAAQSAPPTAPVARQRDPDDVAEYESAQREQGAGA